MCVLFSSSVDGTGLSALAFFFWLLRKRGAIGMRCVCVDCCCAVKDGKKIRKWDKIIKTELFGEKIRSPLTFTVLLNYRVCVWVCAWCHGVAGNEHKRRNWMNGMNKSFYDSIHSHFFSAQLKPANFSHNRNRINFNLRSYRVFHSVFNDFLNCNNLLAFRYSTISRSICMTPMQHDNFSVRFARYAFVWLTDLHRCKYSGIVSRTNKWNASTPYAAHMPKVKVTTT